MSWNERRLGPGDILEREGDILEREGHSPGEILGDGPAGSWGGPGEMGHGLGRAGCCLSRGRKGASGSG